MRDDSEEAPVARQVTWDVVGHARARNRMFACWVIASFFWAWSWYSDWVTALMCMVANAYCLLSVYFFFQTYPSKKEDI